MKLSRYNYKVEYGNKYILFNGVTGCLFSIKKSENKLFETLFRNLDFFEEKQPDLFESIEKMGFIINNSTNEINHILLRNKKAILLDKTYDVFINPTLECNFKCWYCYENRIKGRMNKATIDKLKKHLTFMVEKDRITALNLSWFGGEPLLYFKEIVFEFSLFAKKLCKSNNIPFKNSITSNGFLINKRMIDDFKTINLNRFQITLDGNKEKHDKIRTISGLGTYERIISNIKDLLQHHKDALINLRINYDNNTLKNIDDLYIDFDDIDENNKKQLKFHFQQVWQVNINEDTVKLLNKKVRNTSKLGFCNNSFPMSPNKTHTCYSSRYYHAEFNYDGKVYRCTARDYSDKYVVGELQESGRIRWNDKYFEKVFSKTAVENEVCIHCIHMPICGGPCAQKRFENDDINKNCLLTGTNMTIENFIINRYEEMHKTR